MMLLRLSVRLLAASLMFLTSANLVHAYLDPGDAFGLPSQENPAEDLPPVPLMLEDDPEPLSEPEPEAESDPELQSEPLPLPEPKKEPASKLSPNPPPKATRRGTIVYTTDTEMPSPAPPIHNVAPLAVLPTEEHTITPTHSGAPSGASARPLPPTGLPLQVALGLSLLCSLFILLRKRMRSNL